MLIDHMVNKYQVSADQSGNCSDCTHIQGTCSGSCKQCLDEIHWGPKTDKRTRYNCDRLTQCYIKCYAYKYHENIKSVCRDIDFSKYPNFNILSCGCGASPDLMAFETIANGKAIRYNGIDDEKCWENIQEVIINYAANESNLDVNFEQRDIFSYVQGVSPTEIYNVAIIQFLISSVFSRGGEARQVIRLFKSIVDSELKRWRESSSTSPFLFVLNDVESRYRGRNTFYRLIDILEEAGYKGEAFAKSQHETGDLGQTRWSKREGKHGYGGIKYNYSACTSHNSASLVIELTK